MLYKICFMLNFYQNEGIELRKNVNNEQWQLFSSQKIEERAKITQLKSFQVQHFTLDTLSAEASIYLFGLSISQASYLCREITPNLQNGRKLTAENKLLIYIFMLRKWFKIISYISHLPYIL